jgi:hypothetical protein
MGFLTHPLTPAHRTNHVFVAADAGPPWSPLTRRRSPTIPRLLRYTQNLKPFHVYPSCSHHASIPLTSSQCPYSPFRRLVHVPPPASLVHLWPSPSAPSPDPSAAPPLEPALRRGPPPRDPAAQHAAARRGPPHLHRLALQVRTSSPLYSHVTESNSSLPLMLCHVRLELGTGALTLVATGVSNLWELQLPCLGTQASQWDERLRPCYLLYCGDNGFSLWLPSLRSVSHDLLETSVVVLPRICCSGLCLLYASIPTPLNLSGSLRSGQVRQGAGADAGGVSVSVLGADLQPRRGGRAHGPARAHQLAHLPHADMPAATGTPRLPRGDPPSERIVHLPVEAETDFDRGYVCVWQMGSGEASQPPIPPRFQVGLQRRPIYQVSLHTPSSLPVGARKCRETTLED